MSSQHKPTVSVIIPCYNGARFLAETLESVLAQTYPYFEIIIVDDGSKDTTRDVASRYPQARYIYQENRGVCATRNRGFQNSKGEYLVFLDQDDRLLPEALEIGISQLKAHPTCGAVMGCYQLIDSTGGFLHKTLQTNRGSVKLIDYPTMLKGHCPGPPSGGMFRRDIFELVGGFDLSSPQDAADLDLYLRIIRECPIYFHNQVVYEYRRHPGNCSLDVVHMTQQCIDTFERQWSYVQGNSEYEAAYQIGIKYWEKFFYPEIPTTVVAYLKNKKFKQAWNTFLIGLRLSPQSFVTYALRKFKHITGFA